MDSDRYWCQQELCADALHMKPSLSLSTITLCCLLAACAPTPMPPPTAVPARRLPSPSYGFEAYLWWKEEIATRDLGLIREAGFDWVKQTFAWRDIELEKGKYDWSRADRVVFLATEVFTHNLIVRLDREPWWDRRDYPLNQGIAAGPPRDLQNFYDFCGVIAALRVVSLQKWTSLPVAKRFVSSSPPFPHSFDFLI